MKKKWLKNSFVRTNIKQKIINTDKFLFKAPSYINKNNPPFNNTVCAAIQSKKNWVCFICFKSKKDEDDVSFDNVCDSKGSTHSG